MRLKADQLAGALSKALLPIYWVSGDEPLQVSEAADQIRQAARLAGYGNRELISIDTGHEWPQLSLEADSLSIFAEQKLIDLRLPSGKPGQEGSKVLQAYCQRLPTETILLITSARIESAAQKSQWFQSIDAVGAMIQVWPLQGAELISWLQRRAKHYGLEIDQDALKTLASLIEGNLLAAAQELQKLYILHGQRRITKTMVEDQVGDSARFDVFKLTDALLQGKLNRAVKILNGLKAEGVAAPVILWALSRETRNLIQLRYAQQHAVHPDNYFRQQPGFEKRKPLLQEALKRLNDAELQRILKFCAQTDQQIKGQLTGDGWESLFAICCLFAKLPVPKLPI